MADGEKQRRHERKVSNENAAIGKPSIVTIGELRAFVGERVFSDLWLAGIDGQDCDQVPAQVLIDRYSGQDGLTLFLTECFPASTSKNPFGPYQRRSIATCESVVRNGGVQQSLEPRSTGKTSRLNRAALWALLFGLRKFGVCFQANQRKSRQSIETAQNEIIGNVALRAMFPLLSAAFKHAKDNPRLQGKQHVDGRATNISSRVDAIRFPDLYDQAGKPLPFSGGRLMAMPFSKAAGLSLNDPTNLGNLRPDLLLVDDVQSHDRALSGAGSNTQANLDLWYDSLRYLGGRDSTIATFFCQTICRDGDMASQLAKDKSIQTIQYGIIIEFPEADKWWRTEYRDVLLDYDPEDPEGQVKARRAATELYRDNWRMANAGAVVSWDYAFDPNDCASTLEAAYRKLIENEQAFWSQDQNQPLREDNKSDIRVRADIVATRLHTCGRRIVPSFADRLIAQIDVHDSLLYFAIAAGNAKHQMGIVDYQTWPPQSLPYYTLENAPAKFASINEYANLATVEDQITAALNDLIGWLINDQQFTNADGYPFNLDAIGIDCGDHFDLIHAVARDSRYSSIIRPTRGVSPRATEARTERTAAKRLRTETR